MPLLESEERDVKHRLTNMYMDTIKTFEMLSENAEFYFGENGAQIRDAIQEYLEDFIRNPDGKERLHPEAAIFKADRVSLQNAGFYGIQLSLKERQVTEANEGLRKSISSRTWAVFRAPFKKWVGRINNFLGSLTLIGVGEALKEIKDCMREEMPNE